MNLTDISRTFHSNKREYIFSSELHGTVFKTDHILGHKASLYRYKKIETTPCILSDHHGLKLDINNNRINRKFTNSWKLNNTNRSRKKLKAF
jgi:endonuclease/exonuclease/phosphatase family metal-dependent hydrolase